MTRFSRHEFIVPKQFSAVKFWRSYMEMMEKFSNAAEQLQSLRDVQSLLCANAEERPGFEEQQRKYLKTLLDSGFRFFGKFESLEKLLEWADQNPAVAVGPGRYDTRLAFDAGNRKFVVLKREEGHEFACGPSDAQTQALAADSAFTKTLTAAYSTDFGEAQDLFKELHSNFESIIAKGPSQQGASPEELAAENSQAINQAAAANKQVQQQIGEKAAMTGAVPGVESGVTAAVRADAATKVEENLGNQEGKILTRSYDIGRENYNAAVRGEEELSSATMNPVTSAASPVLGAEKTTGEQADQNAAASSSWMGLVGGLADAAVGGLTKGIGSGAKQAPNQVPDTSSIPSPVPGALFPGMGQPSGEDE